MYSIIEHISRMDESVGRFHRQPSETEKIEEAGTERGGLVFITHNLHVTPLTEVTLHTHVHHKTHLTNVHLYLTREGRSIASKTSASAISLLTATGAHLLTNWPLGTGWNRWTDMKG